MFQRGYLPAWSTQSLTWIFPVENFELIERTGNELGVNPILVLSLIKQESAFREEVVSKSGALGLMQLMPFTALEVDKSLRQINVTDAAVNIQLGTRYLAKLLNSFGGRVAWALAGYNAGPTKAREWTKGKNASGKPQDLEQFVESIPYPETRGYVSGIVRNFYWYQRRLRGEILTSTDQFIVGDN